MGLPTLKKLLLPIDILPNTLFTPKQLLDPPLRNLMLQMTRLNYYYNKSFKVQG